MQLTESQIATLKSSYQMLKPHLERVAPEFYQDLFRRDPSLRELFRENLDEQGMRFMSAIGVIIQNADNPERLEHEIGLIAKGHAAMKIRPEWYHTMQEALLDTFRYALGARFTDEIHLAWRNVFEQICERMASEAADPVTG